MDIYSPKNLLVCGAQTARSRNTGGVERTRSFSPRGEAVGRSRIFGVGAEEAGSESAAFSDRDRLAGADTDHCVIGFAPFGGAAQLGTR